MNNGNTVAPIRAACISAGADHLERLDSRSIDVALAVLVARRPTTVDAEAAWRKDGELCPHPPPPYIDIGSACGTPHGELGLCVGWTVGGGRRADGGRECRGGDIPTGLYRGMR